MRGSKNTSGVIPWLDHGMTLQAFLTTIPLKLTYENKLPCTYNFYNTHLFRLLAA
ncbi:MAG TPA: hypothetical protein LFV92_01470 [Rickettsia endosymbiont of Ceroptres masudai]|nr:hypothetical protein [Rickettsia endosymbiont of Ceroptres masudai]